MIDGWLLYVGKKEAKDDYQSRKMTMAVKHINIKISFCLQKAPMGRPFKDDNYALYL